MTNIRLTNIRREKGTGKYCFLLFQLVAEFPGILSGNKGYFGILHLSQKVVYTFVISRFRREIGNWKLEIRKKHINSDVLSNFWFRISSFSIRFSDSTSDFQPENIPHFREKRKLMDEGCPWFFKFLILSIPEILAVSFGEMSLE